MFGDGRDRTDWPGVDLSPDGRWLAITRQPGVVEERGLPRRRHAGGASLPPSRWPPARTRSSTSSRCSTIASTCSRPAAPRAGGCSPSIPAHPARAHWREVIAESRPRSCKRVVYFHGGLAVRVVQDAALRLRLLRRRRRAARRDRAARAGRADGADRRARRRRARSTGSRRSSRRPRCFAVQLTAPRRRAVVWRALQAPIDPAAFEVERVMVTSRDGTRMPLFLAHRKGLEARRHAARAAHRLRRLRPSACCRPGRRGDPVPRARRHLRGRQPARRRRVRRGLAPRRHARATSRTCSTTSSRRPNG